MSKQTLALLAVASAALLTACSSTSPDKAGGPQASDASPRAVTGVTSVAPVVADHLNPNSLISTQRSVYFDYDKFEVKSQFAPVVERQGKYLAGKSGLAIRVEGHADERGGREYNLALGQKRAEAVVRALKVYGVTDKQMEPVSFGKEKPKAMGHDEAAWAENRRVDLAYPNK